MWITITLILCHFFLLCCMNINQHLRCNVSLLVFAFRNFESLKAVQSLEFHIFNVATHLPTMLLLLLLMCCLQWQVSIVLLNWCSINKALKLHRIASICWNLWISMEIIRVLNHLNSMCEMHLYKLQQVIFAYGQYMSQI